MTSFYGAGELDRRVDLFKYGSNANASGSRTKEWTYLKTVFAKYKPPVKSQETVEGGETSADEWVTWVIRFVPGIDALDQVRHDCMIYDIQEARIVGRNEYLELLTIVRRKGAKNV